MNHPLSPSRLPLLVVFAAVALIAGCSGSDSGPTTPSTPAFVPPLAVVQGPVANAANGHVYYRLASAGWAESQAAAVRYFGGHLVVVDDDQENTFILGNFADAGGSGPIWLGLTDAATEGTFVAVSGATPAYTNWAPGQPADAGGEDFVAMAPGNGVWADVDGTPDAGGVGPFYGVVEVETPVPTFVVQGPVVNPANGHTYYRLDNTDWTTADAYAREVLGGYLVRIGDAAENTFVQTNFAQFAVNGRVWLGLSDAASEGTFVWTDGTTPTFTQWEAGEPNNSGDEDYVAMYANNGNWVDVKDQANPFGIGPVYGVVEVE